MTNRPTWRLQAIEDADGAQLDAAIDFPDSAVEISVAAPDIIAALNRFGDLINGWRKYLPEPDPEAVVYDTATITRLLKGESA
ncbi:hypothetical protein P9A16_10855 [Shinella sp. 838]|uniref:hypothetical protein n=1 Tax=Shinella sp. 838 TaxID=3038164 RepID=UPI0024150296|nr:hypothetical protein [Shinella sp. 838]MDG4671628.1 hypothetical protein [Shinella sp. 838]